MKLYLAIPAFVGLFFAHDMFAAAFPSRKPATTGQIGHFMRRLKTAQLFGAAALGEVGEINMLLTQGADINGTCGEAIHKGQTALHRAADKGHVACVEALLAHGANPNIHDGNGFLPLHLATASGCIPVLEYFIKEQNMHPDLCTLKGETTLHVAAQSNQLPAIKYVLAQGATLQTRNSKHVTALEYAWRLGHADAVSCMTGLSLTPDPTRILIPTGDPHLEKMPEWKKFMCAGFVNLLPDEAELFVQKFAQALSVNDVIFFETKRKTAFATSAGFPKIGLPTSLIERIIRANSAEIDDPEIIINIKRTLYHELCHIRSKHILRKTEEEQLTDEMEAELGATYHLFTIEDICHFVLHNEDNRHPSNIEHNRYKAQLYDRLLANPDADYSIVTELAELYRREKTEGTPMVADIVKPIAEKLFSSGKLSPEAYLSVIMADDPSLQQSFYIVNWVF